MRIDVLQLSTAALVACGGAQTSNAVTASAPPPVESHAAPAPAPTHAAVAQAVAPHAMPVCHAGDLRSLATLTDGVPAHATIATNGSGALVAYVTDANHDGNGELSVLALDASGAPHGAAQTVVTGPRADAPALTAHGDGFVLAWREGAPGAQRVMTRTVDATGAMSGNATVALDEHGSLGMPGISRVGSDVVVAAVAAAPAAASHGAHAIESPQPWWGNAIVWRRLTESSSHTIPAGADAFDARVAPRIVDETAPYIVAQKMLAGPSPTPVVVALPLDDSHPTRTIAVDADGSDVLVTEHGSFVGWRTEVTRHDVAIRVQPMLADADRPPWTVATFRGAFDAEVRLVPMGDAIAAFMVSTLADDAGGALNVSMLDTNGAYLGRQPLLFSSVLRNARVVAAQAGAQAWFVFEGRADTTGAPALGLAPVTCSRSETSDPREIPPAGLVQRLAEIQEPTVQLATVPASNACTAVGSATQFATHRSGTANALADTSAAAVALPRATALFAVVRDAADHPTHLAVGSVDTAGRAEPAQSVLDGAVDIEASARVGANAVAFVTVRTGPEATAPTSLSLVTSAPGRHPQITPLAIEHVTSVAVSQDGQRAFVVGESPSQPGVGLFVVPLGAAHPAVTRIAWLAPGDRVLDAFRRGHDTTLLLARADRFGADVAHALARIVLADRDANRPLHIDPFADPLGHGRGNAFLVAGATEPTVIYRADEILRAGDIDHNQLRNLRSLVEAHPRGGAIVASTVDGPTRWMLFTSGVPEHPASGSDVPTFEALALTARGEPVLLANNFTGGSAAVPDVAAIASFNGRTTTLFATVADDGTATWSAHTANCVLPSEHITAQGAHR